MRYIKKPINFKLNQSVMLEKALENEVRIVLRKKWLTEKKRGIEICNELAEYCGLFADKYRVF